MTRYLLDTTTLIDYSKGHEPSTSRIDGMFAAGDELGLCAVNIAEFMSGVSPEERVYWWDILSAFHYWDITKEAAGHAGYDRYDFARRGRALSIMDALIAAVAREYGAIIVTDNVRAYPMDDVQLLPLRT